MFDHVHRGWLDSDDYRVAAEAAGVVELPEPAEPEPDVPAVNGVLDDLLTRSWTDRDPGSVGK